MAWLPYMIVSGLVLLGGASAAMLSLINTPPDHLWKGIAVGGGMGVVLMAIGWYTTLKGVNSATKKDAIGHMVGGFFLRFLILVVGIFALAFTGWGHPAGFALAFLLAVMCYLGLRTIKVMKALPANMQAA